MSTPAMGRLIALYGTKHINDGDGETEVKAVGFEVLEAGTVIDTLNDDSDADLLVAAEMNLSTKSLEPGLYTLSEHRTSDSGSQSDRFIKTVELSAGSINMINAKP